MHLHSPYGLCYTVLPFQGFKSREYPKGEGVLMNTQAKVSNSSAGFASIYIIYISQERIFNHTFKNVDKI
jgi:hypothetical protein